MLNLSEFRWYTEYSSVLRWCGRGCRYECASYNRIAALAGHSSRIKAIDWCAHTSSLSDTRYTVYTCVSATHCQIQTVYTCRRECASNTRTGRPRAQVCAGHAHDDGVRGGRAAALGAQPGALQHLKPAITHMQHCV